jgi:hypothetical protein
MSNATKINVLPGNEDTAQKLLDQLFEMRKKAEEEQVAILDSLRALEDRSASVNVKKCSVEGGKRFGLTIHGFGKPQFFYPTHLMVLLDESEQGKRVREKLRQQVEAMRAELTWGTK